MTDRLVQHHARPAGAKQHGHLADRRGHRAQIDLRLLQRLVDGALPARFLEQRIVEIAPAEAQIAGLAPAIFFHDDRDVEADERPHIRCYKAIGPHDLDHGPAARQHCRDLHHARIARPRRCIDLRHQLHLLREGHEVERVGVSIEVPVGALGRGRHRLFGGIEQLQRFRRAADRPLADVIGMGEAGRLARNAAQAEAPRRPKPASVE